MFAFYNRKTYIIEVTYILYKTQRVRKIKGYTISYKPKDSGSRTLFHHTLFGRIVYRNYRGRKYAYYAPGILDDILFARLLDGKIFVESIENIDIDLLNIFGDITISSEERDEEEISLKTGKEHWQHIASEKNLLMRTKRSSRKKNDEDS